MEIAVVVLALLVVLLMVVVLRGGATGRTDKGSDIAAAPSSAVSDEVRLLISTQLGSAVQELARMAATEREEFRKLGNQIIDSAVKQVDTVNRAGLGETSAKISTTLDSVNQQITGRMAELNTELQRMREINNGQFTSVEKAVEALAQRTENLKEVLSSAQKRGQWGERVAEDMLRAAGFIENVNYDKQTNNVEGGRPDYCFKMPPSRVLFMDVKFPLDKYALHLAAEDDQVRARTKTEFVNAVKGHVTALAKRDYVLNSTVEALDYVLMFVPNESISGFVHEADPTLIDWALDKKVVLCSPLTLYAFLVVIRQATDSFHTEQTAASIMQQINKFKVEWDKYSEAVEKVQTNFRKLEADIDSIATGGTRFKKLAVPVRDIEKMRKNQGIPEISSAPASEVPSFDDLLDD